MLLAHYSKKLLQIDRKAKRGFQVSFDILVQSFTTLSLFMAQAESVGDYLNGRFGAAFILSLAISTYVFARIGLYRAVLRFASTKILATIIKGVAVSTAVLTVILSVFGFELSINFALGYAFGLFVFLATSRFAAKALLGAVGREDPGKTSVDIVDVSHNSLALAKIIDKSSNYFLRCFIDTTGEFVGTTVDGVEVISQGKLLNQSLHSSADVVLFLDTGNLTPAQNELLSSLKTSGISTKVMPSLFKMLQDSAELGPVEGINIEDVLGRPTRAPVTQLLEQNVSGLVVAVTGAGGSIGSEICRQCLKLRPKSLLLIDHSEFALYELEQELQQQSCNNVHIEIVLCSVSDKSKMTSVFVDHAVNTVYHAAAYKHVPMLEKNVIAALENNVFGTRSVAEAAIYAKVKNFTMVSTDKSVRPTNVMGATKRLAELVCQALQNEHNLTCFSIVRFGNVLGSSGSVIPLFEKQISAGGPITVTHPDVTRYFMTKSEAAQLVIQASTIASGGEVFVLDMGSPVKILDLAMLMARLKNFEPDIEASNSMASLEATKGATSSKDTQRRKMPISFVGLRDGEKMYEELLVSDTASKTSHPLIFSEQETAMEWQALLGYLGELSEAKSNFDNEAIVKLLLQGPLDYSIPTNNM